MNQVFKFYLIFGLIYCVIYPVYSQDVMRLTIVDTETNHPIPFASIYTKDGKINTISNEKGVALVETTNLDSLSAFHVSSVGYNTIEILLSEIINQGGIVEIKPNTLFLNGILVFSQPLNQKAIQKLAKKAIKETRKLIQPYTSTGIYKHYKKQNGLTTSASISQFIIRDKSGMRKAQDPVRLLEDVQYFNSAESYDFTSKRLFFERSYLDTYVNKGNILLWNPLKYSIIKDDHFYKLSDTIVNDNQIQYIINAVHLDTAKYGMDIPFREGFDLTYFLSIDPQSKDQLEINKVEVKYRMLQSFKKVSIVESSTWSMELGKYENFIFPSKISLHTNQLYNFSDGSENLNLSASHIYHISDAKRGIESHINVDSMEFKLDDEITAELQSSPYYHSSMGFLNNLKETLDDEQLELRKVKGILGSTKNDKYIIFWDTYDVPYDHRYLLDINQSVGLSDIVFINTQLHRNDWLFLVSGNSYDHFYQFHLPYTHQELIKKYCDLVKVPLYVKITANGQVHCSEKTFIDPQDALR